MKTGSQIKFTGRRSKFTIKSVHSNFGAGKKAAYTITGPRGADSLLVEREDGSFFLLANHTRKVNNVAVEVVI